MTCVVCWYWWNERPAALYHSARKVSESDPAAAEELVVSAIVQSGGTYPAAELFHSLLSARRQQWTTALAAFRLIRNPQTCDGGELVELTERALAANEYALARMSLDAALPNRQVSSDPALLRRVLTVQNVLSSPQRVLESCEQLSRLSPDDWFPWSIRAEMEKRTGKLMDSVTSLRRAIELKPLSSEEGRLQLSLAERLMDLGEVDAARQEMDALLSRGNPSRECLLREAYLCRMEGNADRALVAAEHALQLSPGWSSGLLVRGILRLDAGDAQRAAEDLQAVVGQEPFRKEAHHKLGLALLDLGDEETGRRHLSRARELAAATDELLTLNAQLSSDSPDAAVVRRLIELNRRLGRFDEAERWKRSLSDRK